MGTGRWVLVLNHLATSCHTAVLHFDVFACILVEFYGFMGFSLKVNGFLIVWLDSESVLWHFDGAINCVTESLSCNSVFLFLCDFSVLLHLKTQNHVHHSELVSFFNRFWQYDFSNTNFV